MWHRVSISLWERGSSHLLLFHIKPSNRFFSTQIGIGLPEGYNISLYRFRKNSATLPNMTYFSQAYHCRSEEVVCTELGRLTGRCSWGRGRGGGHTLPPVLPHNGKSGFHIPIKTERMDRRIDMDRAREEGKKSVDGIGRGPQDNVWDVLRKKDGSR